MKKLITFIGAPLLLICHQAIAQVSLDINNVKAYVDSTPVLFTDKTTLDTRFFVPKTGFKSTLYCSSVWLGGVTQGTLHLSAETYRQYGTHDFQNGPVSNSYSNPNKWPVIKLLKSDIDNYRNDPDQWIEPPLEIANWPAHGDASNGQATNLAPFVNVGGDPLKYEPEMGDYPKIKGDQCIYYIFNDDMLHTETGGLPLKAEIQRMVYAYTDTADFLNNTIWVDYVVTNRSINSYDQVRLTLLSDYDIGLYNDDYVGTDTSLNMVYAYNGNLFDSSFMGYGLNPPAEGMLMLNHRLGNSMSYDNTFSSINGNPFSPENYWNYMNAKWMNGDIQTYQGAPTPYCYTGNACENTGWTEGSVNPPNDKRIIASSESFSLYPGETYTMTVAYLYARGTDGPNSSVCKLKTDAQKLINWYNAGGPTTGIGEKNLVKEQLMQVYPNPASNVFSVRLGNHNANLTIYDSQGKEVRVYTGVSGEVKVSDLKAGIYLVKASVNDTYDLKKVVVN